MRLLLILILSIPAWASSASDDDGYSDRLEIDARLVERTNKRRGSYNSFLSKYRKKSGRHLYRRELEFQAELKATLEEVIYAAE